jgi:hypothetical protein
MWLQPRILQHRRRGFSLDSTMGAMVITGTTDTFYKKTRWLLSWTPCSLLLPRMRKHIKKNWKTNESHSRWHALFYTSYKMSLISLYFLTVQDPVFWCIPGTSSPPFYYFFAPHRVWWDSPTPFSWSPACILHSSFAIYIFLTPATTFGLRGT